MVVDELGRPVKTDWLRRRCYKFSEVLTIMRGHGLISPEQAEALASLASVDVKEVLACVPRLPEAGIAEVEHPRWRPALFRLAATTNTTETDARMRVARGVFKSAARQESAAEEAAKWRARIGPYLESELSSEDMGVSTPRCLRSMTEAQAEAMPAVLESQRPGAAARLAGDALRERGTWSGIRVHIASESETRGSGCSVAGIYRDETSPLSVALSGSRRHRSACARLAS